MGTEANFQAMLGVVVESRKERKGRLQMPRQKRASAPRFFEAVAARREQQTRSDTPRPRRPPPTHPS